MRFGCRDLHGAQKAIRLERNGDGTIRTFKRGCVCASPFKDLKKLREIAHRRKILWYNLRMKNLMVKRRFTRMQAVATLALATSVLFLLTDIPFLSEYLFARGITRWLSGLIGLIANAVPFSLYEIAAILLIVGAVLLITELIVLLRRKQFARIRKILYRLLLIALGVLFAFGVLYAPLYNRSSVFEALGLSPVKVTQENVYAAAEYYIDALNGLSARMERDEDGNVLPEVSFSELADILNGEYAAQGSGYFSPYYVRPKKVALSELMSYLGITGIYIPFFAEANVNICIPTYVLGTTMAHEMAHAKGVSQESEANMTAYVLCIRAENDFLNYSGLMSAVSVLLNALPEEEYTVLRGKLDDAVLQEYRNASAHYAKYEGAIQEISEFFNDLFLKSNGVSSGIRSYGQTTQCLVSLYLQLTEK